MFLMYNFVQDDSRQAASILFPDKALSLKLKKHHGTHLTT